MSNFVELKNVSYITPFAGLKARIVHSDNQTIAFWEIEKGAVLPKHNHPHEQVSMVTKGELELTIGGETQLVQPGMVAVIPGNIYHSAIAITDVEVTDVFYPKREDL